MLRSLFFGSVDKFDLRRLAEQLSKLRVTGKGQNVSPEACLCMASAVRSYNYGSLTQQIASRASKTFIVQDTKDGIGL